MTKKIEQAITDLIAIGIAEEYIDPLDKIIKQNQLMALLKRDSISTFTSPSNPLPEAVRLLPIFIEYGIETGLISDDGTATSIFSAQVMAIITPDTSVVNRKFWGYYDSNPIQATNWFHRLSMTNDYIQTQAIAKNIAFDYESDYGTLEITINLSKPEKDPNVIANALMEKSVQYPLCQLCLENEGYLGTAAHPARSNHRIVRFPLNEEEWGLQYSPYAYYNEHCIFLSSEHRPMRIEEKTFQNLFGIVEQFPHYFVGSNADLPIVGGSILSHDHYQGGRYCFPMERASIRENFHLPAFPEVSFGIIDWPMSVIRIESLDKQALTKAAVHILAKWRHYSNESVNIYAFSQETPHNTVTPIARRNGDAFVCDLVLRNNRTNAKHPDGIFHPHQDVQHIKKENIGLIEVMGLAILPPRLKKELREVEHYLKGEKHTLSPVFRNWADEVVVQNGDYPRAINKAVGRAFQKVLEDAGVFKMTTEGIAAFKHFIAYL